MRRATREAFESDLIEFVTGVLLSTRTRASIVSAPVQRSTPLFETGIIDSLGIFDLIAFVEDATGSPIPLCKVDLKHFGSIERISGSFWCEEEGR